MLRFLELEAEDEEDLRSSCQPADNVDGDEYDLTDPFINNDPEISEYSEDEHEIAQRRRRKRRIARKQQMKRKRKRIEVDEEEAYQNEDVIRKLARYGSLTTMLAKDNLWTLIFENEFNVLTVVVKHDDGVYNTTYQTVKQSGLELLDILDKYGDYDIVQQEDPRRIGITSLLT